MLRSLIEVSQDSPSASFPMVELLKGKGVSWTLAGERFLQSTHLGLALLPCNGKDSDLYRTGNK